MLICKNCNVPLIKKHQKQFCSSSCAAKFNNVHFPKRKKEGVCNICHISISSRKKYCEMCRTRITKERYNNITKQEFLTSDTQRYRKIRNHARITAEKLGLLQSCFNCGYSLHVETCHIQPIETYSDSTLVCEINSPNNLIGLCRNCHWEFDNGFLSINK